MNTPRRAPARTRRARPAKAAAAVGAVVGSLVEIAANEALQRHLDRGLAFDAEYGPRRLSNHLPMALCALARLGADEARLAAFFDGYVRDKALPAAPPPGGWRVGDAWASRLGEASAGAAYRELFGQWLQHEAPGAVLAQALPVLMPGVGAAAFHGLLRTAFGLQAAHAGELAEGLAHWATTYLPLGDWPAEGLPTHGEAVAATREPAALLRKLAAGRLPDGLIATQMADAARGGQVNRVIAALQVDPGTPERLARAAAFAYAETGNFTALHLVTGTQAMRVLARHADDATAAWRWFWQAYAHGVVAARLQPAAAVPLLPWPEAVAAAMASEDEHVIKLVDAAREEHRFYGGKAGSDWQRAASRAVAAAD